MIWDWFDLRSHNRQYTVKNIIRYIWIPVHVEHIKSVTATTTTNPDNNDFTTSTLITERFICRKALTYACSQLSKPINLLQGSKTEQLLHWFNKTRNNELGNMAPGRDKRLKTKSTSPLLAIRDLFLYRPQILAYITQYACSRKFYWVLLETRPTVKELIVLLHIC